MEEDDAKEDEGRRRIRKVNKRRVNEGIKDVIQVIEH